MDHWVSQYDLWPNTGPCCALRVQVDDGVHVNKHESSEERPCVVSRVLEGAQMPGHSSARHARAHMGGGGGG
jgi:hypothetical protein